MSLSKDAHKVLKHLFFRGPTINSDLPSKQGRDELVKSGHAEHHRGMTSLTKKGVKHALDNGLYKKKKHWLKKTKINTDGWKIAASSDQSSGADETLKCLFFHGPTWDGNIPSKQGRDELCDSGHAEHRHGFAYLTRKGIDLAISKKLHDAKDKWEREKSELNRKLLEKTRSKVTAILASYVVTANKIR